MSNQDRAGSKRESRVEINRPFALIVCRYYGQPNNGNLLGTIKSLDELNVISLNCTENANVQVHDEVLHCEWGLISQEGWSFVDDSQNYALDENYWWVGPNTNAVDGYL